MSMPLDTWVIYAIRGGPTSGSTKIYINDANTPVFRDTFSAAGFGTSVWIGGTFTNMRGKLAAMALYNDELTDTQFNTAMQALQTEYGITV